MKKYFTVIILLLTIINIRAQHNIINHVSNPYLIQNNYLSDDSAIFDYVDEIGLEHEGLYSNSINSSVFKLYYTNRENNTIVPGLIDVAYNPSNGSTGDFTQGFLNLTTGFMDMEDEFEFVREIHNTVTNNGGYFFHKSTKYMFIYILSKASRARIMVITEFPNLNVEQKKSFAKDFIQKTVFK